jgi:hydroxysqualene dehydroxylase
VVIAAVPWFALPELFDGDVAPLAATLAAARATEPSPIVTVNLWLDRPVLERPFLGLPGRTFQWVFDKRLVFGDSASHLSLVSSGAADILMRSNADVIALAEQDIHRALPDARAARTLRATVVREPRATFSLAPGQPTRPQTTTAVDGVLLAGDWIDTGLPATIESAVRSGHRAAAEALQHLTHRAGFSILPSSHSAILQSH